MELGANSNQMEDEQQQLKEDESPINSSYLNEESGLPKRKY